MNSDSRSGTPEEGRPKRRSFLLRLPPELHAELQRWAEAEVRSLNGHVEYLLREALRRHGRIRADTDDEEP